MVRVEVTAAVWEAKVEVARVGGVMVAAAMAAGQWVGA